MSPQIAQVDAPAADPSPPGPPRPGRIAAWLAKQVELGLTDVDLSISQYRVLCLLGAGPSVSSALADRLAVRRPSVTAIIEGLVNRRLVARHAVADDRRCVSHTLTDEGYRVLAAADRAVDERLEALANKIGDAGVAETLMGGLGQWQEAMARHLATRQPESQ